MVADIPDLTLSRRGNPEQFFRAEAEGRQRKKNNEVGSLPQISTMKATGTLVVNNKLESLKELA